MHSTTNAPTASTSDVCQSYTFDSPIFRFQENPVIVQIMNKLEDRCKKLEKEHGELLDRAASIQRQITQIRELCSVIGWLETGYPVVVHVEPLM